MHSKFRRSTLSLSLCAALAAGGAYYHFNTSNPAGYDIAPQKLAYLQQKQAKKEAHPKRFDKPQQAVDFYLSQRAPLGTDQIPTEKYAQALTHMKDMSQYSIRNNRVLQSKNQLAARGVDVEPGVVQQWDNLGPGNIGGRTRTIVIDPDTPETMYTAGVNGGVWKSTNAGGKWAPLDDAMVNLAVTTMVMSAQDNATLFVGTGEGFFNGGAARGDGLFVTKDSGETWNQLAATASNPDFYYVNKIQTSTVVENRLYAATGTGLFRSDDAGDSWTKLMDAPDGNGCMDIQIAPADDGGDKVVASCGSFYDSAVFHSPDSGDTLTKVIDDDQLGRTTIAFAPSDSNVVYALGASNLNHPTAYQLGFYKLYRSEDGGATWTVKNSYENPDVMSTLLLSNTVYGVLPECGWGASRSFYNQGWYDNIINVDPVDANVVWVGGVDLFRSDDAGAHWAPASRWWANPNEPSYAHADQHAITFHPGYDGVNNTTMYVGNDGGIQRTDNARANLFDIAAVCGADSEGQVTWTGLNNDFAITQFYHGAVFPDGSAYFGGTQDNGTLLGAEQFPEDNWVAIAGGDGGWVAVDPRNPDVLFQEYTGLSLRRYDPVAESWVDATSGIDSGASFPFITPFAMDSNNPDRLWIGNDRLWRTDDQGDNWVQASAPTLDESIVSEWAVAPGDSERVIAGTNRGALLISTAASQTDATTQWLQVKPASGYVSDIAISPSNNRVAYVTYSTFGINHIYKTVDGGQTWNAIDNQGQANGLPDIPANTIVIDPNNTARLFVGTDLGVFVSVDAGQNWSVDGSGFSNTSVVHLEINNGELYAFTHGRSAYKVELSQLPSALAVSATTDEDTALTLSSGTFSSFAGGQPQISHIALTDMPENGTIKVNGEAITELAPFAVTDLDKVSFEPASDFNGDVTVGWYSLNGEEASSTKGRFTITVNAVNDAPSFSLQQGTTSVVAGNNGYVTVATPQAAAVPADEQDQGVTYSLSPTSVDFLNVSFNEQTGELRVAPLAELTGSASFTITATDGQSDNATHSETASFEVTKPKSSGGGSFGWMSLLALFGVAARVRRRK